MTTNEIEDFNNEVINVIKDWFKGSGFKDRKITDTPTDDLQVVNKKYVDSGSFVNDATIVITDITTNNVTSTKHGWAPKSPADATKFLNGDTTPAYALVKDSDLSTSDITSNDASTSKHGFLKKLSNVVTQFTGS